MPTSEHPAARLRRVQRRAKLAANVVLCIGGGMLLAVTAWVGIEVTGVMLAGDSGAPLAAVSTTATSAQDAPRQVRAFVEPAPFRPQATSEFSNKASAAEQTLAWSRVRDATPAPAASATYDGPTFNGRPIRPVRTIHMHVTAYSPDERSCGKWADGITASGKSVWTNGMKLVAADTRILPFGSIVTVPGYNGERPVPVLDRGGAIKGHRLDVLYPTHAIARQWGNQYLDVTVWEYADED